MKRSKDVPQEQSRGPWELSGIQHVWILSSVLSFWHSLIENKVKVKLTQSCLTLCDSMDWILQARILEWLAVPLSRASSQPRNQTQVSRIAAEPQGNPKNTEVGSLSLLQRIFLTQELNWGLLHCRPTELSGKPLVKVKVA